MSCAKYINHECSVCNKNKIMSLSEYKSTFRLINNDRKLVCKIRVDNCYIKDGKQCDYLILNCNDKKAFFIELKGCMFIDAIKQIHNSIRSLTSDIPNFTIYGRIVLTKVSVPNLENNPHILRLIKILKKSGGNLINKVSLLIEQI
jgi:hypothetical protein